MNEDYFTGKSGRKYTYAELARLIREKAPETLGKHISLQLRAIGLMEEMEGGTTPCSLPFSFAFPPQPLQKQLTSSEFVHTPGFFRAMQNDYRIKGGARQRAIKVMCDVYRLSQDEAVGLLSGSIPVETDEKAATVTYTVEA